MFQSARAAAATCTPVFTRCYPAGSPALGLHLALHARLEQYLCNPRQGQSRLTAAIPVGSARRGCKLTRVRSCPRQALVLADRAMDVLRLTHGARRADQREAPGGGAMELLARTQQEAELECRQAQLARPQPQLPPSF